MYDFLRHPISIAVGSAAITCILFAIYRKWPNIKAFFKPDEFQRSLTANRDELEKEVKKLRQWKELLMDEVTILRRVDLLKTAKLDEANAELVRIRGGVGKLLKTVGHDELTDGRS